MPRHEGVLDRTAWERIVGLSATDTIGFYGVTPVVQAATQAAGTDAATTQALANALRVMARNLGFMA